MMSFTGKLIVTIQIFSNVSRGKSNQTVKFGQLIEHNMKKSFVKSHIQSVMEKQVPDPFLNN